MSKFSTPQKQVMQSRDTQSCLKQNSSPTWKAHKASSSQVRFSLPPENETEESPEDFKQGSSFSFPSPKGHGELSRSPNKIVYPRTSLRTNDEMPTFVDYSNKVTVPVPKDIWEFHNRKDHSRGTSKDILDLYSTSNAEVSPRKGHSRANSLQSIIAETIETYKPEGKAQAKLRLNKNQIVLPYEEKPAELYLRPDSPMNKYEVPIPLQIALPPYLSPENKSKNKRRNSLVFDGDGYSVYLGYDDSEGSIYSGSSKVFMDESFSSDISIPSAENNLSFNISDGDIDKKLGIDNDANVDLKKQVRNLKRASTPTVKQNTMKPLPNPTAKSVEIPAIVNKSLEILSTPSKQIKIPDIDDLPVSSSKGGSLKFFDSFIESNQQDNEQLNASNGPDELNINFKFPNMVIKNKSDTDFIKVPYEEPNDDITRRREILRQRNGTQMHVHRRSRSIHTAGDMNQTMSPIKSSPGRRSAEKITPHVPERSALRPKTSSLTLGNSDQQETCTVDENTQDHDKIIESIYQGVYDVSSEYSNESVFSFTNSLNSHQKKHRKQEEMQEIAPNTKSDPVNADMSIEIVEVKLNIDSASSPKPLSTIHSFRDFTNMPSKNEPDTTIKDVLYDMRRAGSILDPAKSLSNSNTNSHSSYESEFSHQSYSSIGTSNAESQLAENMKNGNFPDVYSSNNTVDQFINGNTCFSNGSGKNDQIHRNKPVESQNMNTFDDYKTILEEYKGKMVEVIVLDPLVEKPNKVGHHKRYNIIKSADITKMCEQTADDVKKVILQLTEKESNIDLTNEKLQRKLPPLPRHLLAEHRSTRPNIAMSLENQRRYIERITTKNRN